MLALVLVSWGESKSLCQRLRADVQGKSSCSMQGEGQKEILGMRSQSIQPFSRLLLQLISMLFMCAPSPFQSWNLHHPVHIKPALEVKLMHTGEEVI